MTARRRHLVPSHEKAARATKRDENRVENKEMILAEATGPFVLWKCGHCGIVNLEQWDACNTCGQIVTEKLSVEVEKAVATGLAYSWDHYVDFDSPIRLPSSPRELRELACLPPRLRAVVELMEEEV